VLNLQVAPSNRSVHGGAGDVEQLRKFGRDRAGIDGGVGEPVELGDEDDVARPARLDRFLQSGSDPVAAGAAVIDADPFGPDVGGDQRSTLRGEVLRDVGYAGVPDGLISHPGTV
jgi:hypothetical protein